MSGTGPHLDSYKTVNREINRLPTLTNNTKTMIFSNTGSYSAATLLHKGRPYLLVCLRSTRWLHQLSLKLWHVPRSPSAMGLSSLETGARVAWRACSSSSAAELDRTPLANGLSTPHIVHISVLTAEARASREPATYSWIFGSIGQLFSNCLLQFRSRISSFWSQVIG